MCTITERLTGCPLAAAEINRFRYLRHEGNRLDPGTLVGAITKGLVLAASTGAPVIGLALFDCNGVRGVLRADWFRHVVLLLV